MYRQGRLDSPIAEPGTWSLPEDAEQSSHWWDYDMTAVPAELYPNPFRCLLEAAMNFDSLGNARQACTPLLGKSRFPFISVCRTQSLSTLAISRFRWLRQVWAVPDLRQCSRPGLPLYLQKQVVCQGKLAKMCYLGPSFDEGLSPTSNYPAPCRCFKAC